VDRTGRGRIRRLAAAAAAIGCAVPLTGCGLLGPGITLANPSGMTVSSGAFVQDTMPQRYTCAAGKAISPPLDWSGAPPGTKSFALVVDDSSTPITPYVYWIVYDISPATSAILQGQIPPGARQAQNSAGKASYDPPCPGAQSHGYRFTIYALDKTINLPNGTPLLKAWTAIAAAAIPGGQVRWPVNATS
jgi:Raf kinase inhibitor-like YbhB/YbcL family protein